MTQAHSSRLEHFLPHFQWQTQHSLESSAAQELCYDTLVNGRPHNLRASFLMYLRGLRAHGTLKESLLHSGFTLLEESRPDVFIVGLVCKPWKWSGEISCSVGADEWLHDNRKGFAKIVTLLGAERREGKTLLYTETRVFVEDDAARKRFALYWALIGPLSGFIRRSWLHHAKHAAENFPD